MENIDKNTIENDDEITPSEVVLQELTKEAQAESFNLLNIAVVVVFVLAISFSFFAWVRPEYTPNGVEKNLPSLSRETLLSGDFTSDLSDYYKTTLPFSDDFRRAHNLFLRVSGIGFKPLPDVVYKKPIMTTEVIIITTTPPVSTELPTSTTTTLPYQPPIIVSKDSYETDKPVTTTETTTSEDVTSSVETTVTTTTEETDDSVNTTTTSVPDDSSDVDTTTVTTADLGTSVTTTLPEDIINE